MKGPWRRFSQPVGAEMLHQVGRVCDTTRPVHSGNIEYVMSTFDTREEAEAYAAELNDRETEYV